MAAVYQDPIADRASWLEWRRGGVGASEVAAIVGLSHFSGATPMRVYLDKLGMLDDGGPTEPMRWGQILEPAIAAAFEVDTGLYVRHAQVLVVDGDHPWRRATLDGLVYDNPCGIDPQLALGVLESKTTGDDSWDDIPDAYAAQVCWQLGLTGHERAWVAVLHRGQRFRIHEVDAEPGAFAILCERVDAFWHDHVLARRPPDVAAVDLDAVRDAWRTRIVDELELEADDELAELARRWADAKAFARTAADAADALEAELRMRIGDAAALTVGGVSLVTCKAQRTPARLDEKALRSAHPELAAEFTRPTGTTRVLRAGKALKTT